VSMRINNVNGVLYTFYIFVILCRWYLFKFHIFVVFVDDVLTRFTFFVV